MRNILVGFLILILSSLCVHCSSNGNSEISKEDFIAQLDEECAKGLKDVNALIAQSKKAKQSPMGDTILFENMTQRLARLSQTLKDVAAPQEDAALLGQFFQEDRNMRELLIKLEETSNAFAKVWARSQASLTQAQSLKEKVAEISSEQNRLKNDISSQSGKRNSVAVRYGFETCASIDPSVAWATKP